MTKGFNVDRFGLKRQKNQLSIEIKYIWPWDCVKMARNKKKIGANRDGLDSILHDLNKFATTKYQNVLKTDKQFIELLRTHFKRENEIDWLYPSLMMVNL